MTETQTAWTLPAPLPVRWDRTVLHPDPLVPGDPTIIGCLTETGHPVALVLDEELREALGLALLAPEGDTEIDPQHLELTRENERLRRENAVLLGETAQLGAELAALRMSGAGQ